MATPFIEFKEKFRNFVLAEPIISGLIGTRFLQSEFGTLRDLQFPAATFEFDLSGLNPVAPVQDFPVIIQTFSNIHYDQAHEIMAAIRCRLNHAIIDPRIVVRVFSTPTELFDEISRTYIVQAQFKVVRMVTYPS